MSESTSASYRSQQQVGAHLRTLREQRGLSQSQLARSLSMGLLALQRVERGARALSVGEILEVAAYFAVAVPTILMIDEDAFDLQPRLSVRAALGKFERDIDTLLALEAVVG